MCVQVDARSGSQLLHKLIVDHSMPKGPYPEAKAQGPRRLGNASVLCGPRYATATPLQPALVRLVVDIRLFDVP
jgi:hypothetical protein